MSYVSAQLALLADLADHARTDPSYDPMLANLRRAVESDRFGIVAHVLAVREGCTADQCGAFALLFDFSRVSANLTERTYDFYIERHVGGWPAIASPAVASTSPTQVVAASGAVVRGRPTSPPGRRPRIVFPVGGVDPAGQHHEGGTGAADARRRARCGGQADTAQAAGEPAGEEPPLKRAPPPRRPMTEDPESQD